MEFYASSQGESQGDLFSNLVLIEEANILIIVNSFIHVLNIYWASPVAGIGPGCWAYTVNTIVEAPVLAEFMF